MLVIYWKMPVPRVPSEQVDEMANEGDARRYDGRFSRIAAAYPEDDCASCCYRSYQSSQFRIVLEHVDSPRDEVDEWQGTLQGD